MKYDPTMTMTVLEVKEFFSSTREFTVTDTGSNLNISYTDNGRTTSSLIWKEALDIQALIRKIQQLVWNHCNNIFD